MKLSTIIAATILLGSWTLRADAQTLYAIDSKGDQLVRIDTESGVASAVGSLGIRIDQAGVDFDADGVFWGFSRDEALPNEAMLYTVDLATGSASIVQRFNLSGFPSGIGLATGAEPGTFYWLNQGALYTLDVPNGQVLYNSTLPIYAHTLEPTGDCNGFYTICNRTSSLYRVDMPVATATKIGPLGRVGFHTAIALGPDGQLWAVDNGSKLLFRIDPITGNESLVGSLGSASIQIHGMAFSPRSACPQPNLPPDVSLAAAAPRLLGDDPQTFTRVQIFGVSDPEGGSVRVQVTAVMADEAPGIFHPDATLAKEGVMLRNEINAGSNGRIYHVYFEATDDLGAIQRGEVTVCVPRDPSRKGGCSDEGPLYSALD